MASQLVFKQDPAIDQLLIRRLRRSNNQEELQAESSRKSSVLKLFRWCMPI